MAFLKWAERKKYIKNLTHQNLSNQRNQLNIASDNAKKVTLRVYVEDQPYIIKKPLLRKYFGRQHFPSNNFVVKK